MKSKKAQVTIFIIIAILIVAGVVAYFALRERMFKVEIPQELNPVYSYFLSCIEDETKNAALLLGSQGGYIELPAFEPGSEYAPFSSQLNFLGTPIQYWYYVSGNGIAEEKVPSKPEMEIQLEEYLESEVLDCATGFATFEEQGFIVELGDTVEEIDVSIKDNSIDISLNLPLSMSFGEITGSQSQHQVKVDSQLGRFYDIARKIYDKEQNELFLEEYGIDVLRLYAPVDGVEITCSPKVWLQQEVKQKLREALEGNVQAIKLKGSYYSLAQPENKYFVQDLGLGEEIGRQGESVNFLYARNWPTKIEVYPDEEPMIAEPIGLQEGLGVLGFCYVPYHFVYDISYPVLIQIYDASGSEIFQFPVAIMIQANQPRKGAGGQEVIDAVPELCKYKNQETQVYTYNVDLEPVEADIDFQCLGDRCDIGKTKMNSEGSEAKLTGLFPQCVNGYISAEAPGYVDKKYLISTNQEQTVNMVLDRLYNISVSLEVDNSVSDDFAIIHFVSEDNIQALSWPEQQSTQLSEGEYEVSVYVYRESSIRISGTKQEECVDAPKSGLLGLFGVTEEKCFTLEIPSQELTNVISGGGKGRDYLTEDRLEKGKVKVKVQSIPLPKSLDELQDSYNLLEVSPVDLEFYD